MFAIKPLKTQPYYGYAIKKLPADSRVEQAVCAYLGMRLGKDPLMSPKEWEQCIDSVVVGLGLDKTQKPKRRISVSNQPTVLNDLLYMLDVATARGWNHIYFTRDQDADWNNVSFYQDVYWQRTINDRKNILEEELNRE